MYSKPSFQVKIEILRFSLKVRNNEKRISDAEIEWTEMQMRCFASIKEAAYAWLM